MSRKQPLGRLLLCVYCDGALITTEISSVGGQTNRQLDVVHPAIAGVNYPLEVAEEPVAGLNVGQSFDLKLPRGPGSG